MADASYDVVIVGGGTKGLVAAMYLTKYGGMSVGIFEDKHELGTGWSAEESPAPGFVAAHCSSYHSREYHILVHEDFPEWAEYGAKVIHHPLSFAAIFREDDTWCGIYNTYLEPAQERTAKLFARFSQRDAEKWLWLWEKVQKYWIPALREWWWSPPKPFGEIDAMDKLITNPESGMNPHWTVMTFPQVLKELFESTEIQQLFARHFQAIGIPVDAHGGGIGAITTLAMVTTGCTYPGGTHTLVHTSQRVIVENGGKTFTQSKVDKIIIENGRAKGVRLADGTEVEAKYAVLSNVDPYQLCVELVGEEHLSHELIRRIKNLETHWTAISWYSWALRDRPRYKAEDFDPDLYLSSLTFLGTKTWDDLFDETHRRRMGMWPDPERFILAIYDHSNVAETGYAPPGMSCPLVEQWVLPATAYSEQEWKELEKRLAEQMLSWWQRYAPNMTWDNVIGYNPITPFFTSRQARNFGPGGNFTVIDNSPSQIGRWRPLPELADGRMPIQNLYATGTAWHPFGNAGCFQGYNVYKVMAEDLNLRKPWEENGRPY